MGQPLNDWPKGCAFLIGHAYITCLPLELGTEPVPPKALDCSPKENKGAESRERELGGWTVKGHR